MQVKATAIPLDIHDPGIVISTDDAQQGETGGPVRGVLGPFTALAGVAMATFLILCAVH